VEAYDGPQIVGMDLHRRRSVLARMSEDGQKLATARITDSPARLTAEVRRAGLHPKVAVEACYGWYWAAGALAAAGAEVHLARPLGVKAFSHRRVKNDELDARDLAGLLRMGRLPEARGRPAGDPRAAGGHPVPRQAGAHPDQRQGPGPRRAGQARHRGDLLGPVRRWGNAVAGELALPQPYSWKVASLRQLIGWLTSEITVLEQVSADLLAGHDACRAAGSCPGSGRSWARSSSPRSATSPGSGTRPGCARGPG
jgi:Transposase